MVANCPAKAGIMFQASRGRPLSRHRGQNCVWKALQPPIGSRQALSQPERRNAEKNARFCNSLPEENPA